MQARSRLGVSIFALALVGAFAFAQSAWAATDGTWTWTLISPTQARITDYSGPGGDVTFPATLGGVQVTDIGNGQPNFIVSHITRAVFPSGVLRISDRAFESSGLSSVVFPDTLEGIGDNAFSGNGLQQIMIPASVSSIGDAAFYLCQQLHAAYFLGDEPASVQNLAFQNASQDFTVYFIQGKAGFAPPPPGPWVPSGNTNLGSYPTAYWPTFTITPSAGAHGAISPAIPTAVLQGFDATFAVAPAAGHHIADVLVDGVSQGAVAAYAFSDVEASHTIAASFAADPPAAPYAVTYGPSGGNTLVQWAGSTGAIGYEIAVDGVVAGTTGSVASSFSIRGLLGPSAKVTVTALGAEGTRSAPAAGIFKPVSAVKIGTVYFAGNSAKLTSGTRRALRHYAALVAAQGFTSLSINGYTARRDHGSWAFRRHLSVARARAVAAYLSREFKRLHVKVKVTRSGHGGADPAGSNSTPSGRAKNRRAELVLQ